MAGLDFLVWAAKLRGIRLVLALGNFWNAYKAPEEFLAWATGTAGEMMAGRPSWGDHPLPALALVIT